MLLAAAPILFDAFARIGGEPESIKAPKGVLFATTATLMFVPVVFSMVHKKQGAKAAASSEMPHAH